MSALAVAIGGFIGAIMRWYIGIMMPGDVVPLGTLFVNLTGSFLLALFSALTMEKWKISSTVKIGVATGFFGAYTTFSTFTIDVLRFWKDGNGLMMIVYLLVTIAFAPLLAYAGYKLGISYGEIKQESEETRN